MRHRSNGVHLGWKRDQSVRMDTVAKKGHLAFAEDALLLVNCEASIAQSPKNLMEMVGVGMVVRAGDQNVVKVDEER